jgi:RecG-like helicase
MRNILKKNENKFKIDETDLKIIGFCRNMGELLIQRSRENSRFRTIRSREEEKDLKKKGSGYGFC